MPAVSVSLTSLHPRKKLCQSSMRKLPQDFMVVAVRCLPVCKEKLLLTLDVEQELMSTLLATLLKKQEG